jgi:hypothetical protein
MEEEKRKKKWLESLITVLLEVLWGTVQTCGHVLNVDRKAILRGVPLEEA